MRPPGTNLTRTLDADDDKLVRLLDRTVAEMSVAASDER